MSILVVHLQPASMPKRPREEGDDQPPEGKAPKGGSLKRPEPLLSKIAYDVGVSPQQVKAAARLLDEGGHPQQFGCSNRTLQSV
mgnify:CR=1 FL=1